MFKFVTFRNFQIKPKKTHLKWSFTYLINYKSSVAPEKNTYSHTILSPKSDFPVRLGNDTIKEIQKAALFSKLYEWQRNNLKGKEYVLHDGPPYANGDLHMGHAVNKILKDINNRSQILQGNKVHYVPGWDCHGLPIELKALQKAKTSKLNEPTNPVETRQIARDFALETVERQKETFKNWGVMADWDEQCYLTLNKSYVKNQLKQFYKMYKSGLIFRALKPVYWSPSSKTALAEADLEYDRKYKSTKAYVALPIKTAPQFILDTASNKKLSAIIWTTTPWTLTANRAICYSPDMKYSVVTLSSKPEELFLVGSGLIDDMKKTMKVEIEKVLEFDGQDLEHVTYYNKLQDETLPFLPGSHVMEGKGSGLVHTAPAHVPGDFLVALKYDMTVTCNVDESGCFTNLDPDLNGLSVLKEGQEAVIARLSGDLLHREVSSHPYPLEWSTKQPVIVRASQQWFIDTAALKDKALAALDKISILPPSSAVQHRQGFRAQLEKRPYWCISRQRAWGVPIPVLYKGQEAIVDERIIDKLCSMVEERGTDVWWTSDVTELVPDDVIHDYKVNPKELDKGHDIMDVWLDSGLSWQILEGRKAQLYSEGVDQLTGWFQSSLLTSLALTDEAPYESIFVHGFPEEDKRRKMSKSLGNVIDPTTIIHGGKDFPAYGVNTLRWWVASDSTQHSQIVISKQRLEECQKDLSRMRKLFRHLLGLISDLEKSHVYQTPELNYFDQYMVEETHQYLKQINEHYNNFRYNNVVQSSLFFMSNKVSALYCHCMYDRLCCSPKNSVERLSGQLVIHTILVVLCKSLGPILPHLVEEVWQHHVLYDKPFYFTEKIPILPSQPVDVSIIDLLLDIKEDITHITKSEDLKKFMASIELQPDAMEKLKSLDNDVLCEVLNLSSVSLTGVMSSDLGGKKWRVNVEDSKNGQCLRCRKYNALENSDICLRCDRVLSSL